MSDLFDVQAGLAALCKCLHDTQQVPQERFLVELHKVRFAAMLRMHPTSASTVGFPKMMQNEHILTTCAEFGGDALVRELFHSCKPVAAGLKSNPALLPGVYLSLAQNEMVEWHPVPGTLTLKQQNTPRDSILCQSATAQYRDTMFRCGGGFGGTLRRRTDAAAAFCKAEAKWEALPPMLKKREGHSATILGGKLYVCGGLSDEFAQDLGEENVHGSVECFDPFGTHQWAQLPRMSTRRYHHTCVALNGRLYVCGGRSPDKAGGEGQLATAETFQPCKRRWEQIPPMLHERAFHVSTASQGKLYVCGGKDFVIECFDPALAFWTVLPPFPSPDPCLSCLACTACQDRLYILSREASEIEAARVSMHRFDLSSGTWKLMPLAM